MNRIYPLAVLQFIGVSMAFSQWNSNSTINTPVCVRPYNQREVRLESDSKGGAIMSWVDFRNDASGVLGDIFIQRLNKSGLPMWAANGVSVCTDAGDQASPSMADLGNGSVIVAWNDWRNGIRDIYAQKIDSMGAVKWAVNGISVITKINEQQDAKVISDGAGGGIFIWQDFSSGAWDVYAQRVDASGNLLWATAGVPICSAIESQINPRVEIDGAGGAIFVWQDKRNGLDYDIYMQHINGAGLVQWSANGVVICNAVSTQSNPKIEPDGAGGAFVAWQDKRNGVDYDVYAQRVNAAGAVQWTANGVGVCKATGSQSAVDMTSQGGVNGAIVTWKDIRNGNYDIYAQKIDPSGVIQWATNGIPICVTAGSQLNPNIVGDGAGGGIIVWQDSSAGTSDIKSQRVNGAGIVQWTAGGEFVGNASNDQIEPKNITDGSGGCIYAFSDKRNNTDYDIYAHHLYANGSAVSGIHETIVLLPSKCFPSPFSSDAVIEINGMNESVGRVNLVVYGIFGEQVSVPYETLKNKIHISRGNLVSGIYFYDITLGGKQISKGKIILID